MKALVRQSFITSLHNNHLMADDKIFADGFIFKQPRPNAPEWVVGSLSLKVEDAIAFLQEREKKGWVNLNINIAQSGKPYVALDTWEPDGSRSNTKPEYDEPQTQVTEDGVEYEEELDF